MSGKHLCIHGHFYQPPREDPWLDEVLPEGSAAPGVNWNQRICDESYGPLSRARRLDDHGRITSIVNCYEWMSFNFGPTLLKWMERNRPDVYGRILDADRDSRARWGHGNAMAQIYHHVIMPLATERDKKAEVAWAVSDFQARFGRDPEGMWLSETAVDTPTLECLAEAGIAFTLLAPRQAQRVQAGRGEWLEVDEGSLDIRRPYLVELPSGRRITVFFYQGELSQAVAFEGLLRDGEAFFRRISGAAGEGLTALATDGETYGHHFTFGEMALAYVLEQAREGRDGLSLTNYAAYLEANPATARAAIRENSSWSCIHGVERWRSDCGCTTGGHPGWNQQWRAPLREGLDVFKAGVDQHFDTAGRTLFADADAAMVEYGLVLSGQEDAADFAGRLFAPGLDEISVDRAWKLLNMQQWALASFASCAWFFDDLARIEPMNGLTFALRAADIAARSGYPNAETPLVIAMGEARSNDPAMGSGADIWVREVMARRESAESLVAQALFTLWARSVRSGDPGTVEWPGVSVDIRLHVPAGEGDIAQDHDRAHAPETGRSDSPTGVLSGAAVIHWRGETMGEQYQWTFEKAGGSNPLGGCVRLESGADISACVPVRHLPWNKLQALSNEWVAAAENAQWARREASVAMGVHFFQEYERYQQTQTMAETWLSMWAPLGWAWVMGYAPEARCLPEFLRLAADEHPERGLLCRRLDQTLCEMAAHDTPDWRALEQCLERAGQLGLVDGLLRMQEAVWDRIQDGSVEGHVAKLAGFA